MDNFSPDSKLSENLFLRREENNPHLPYDKELRFYDAVKNGDIETVKQIMVPLDNSQLGTLSANPLHNLKYHLIITISFITRFCIEGGIDEETAYTLSDVYIQKLDLCTTQKEVCKLHREIIFDYTQRMRQIHNEENLSPTVIQCIDYICNHLHDRLTIDELAEHTQRNATYLCGIFKKEMNITIGNYIRDKRIEAAENMLKYSDYSFVDISNYLAFNSHSHFISVFKKQTGLTPREYRNKYFRKNWK